MHGPATTEPLAPWWSLEPACTILPTRRRRYLAANRLPQSVGHDVERSPAASGRGAGLVTRPLRCTERVMRDTEAQSSLAPPHQPLQFNLAHDLARPIPTDVTGRANHISACHRALPPADHGLI